MVNAQAVANQENQASSRSWNFGGSARYPAKLPKRPRPRPEPKPEPAAAELDTSLGAFDEALGHVNWCRMRGMSPQDVCESIGSQYTCSSWGGAVSILEQYITQMRKYAKARKGKGGRHDKHICDQHDPQ